MNESNKPRRILVACLVVFALLFCLSLLFSLRHTGKKRVTLQVAPSTAQVEVDGKEVNSTVIYLSPKIHSFVFKLSNFTTVAQKVDVSVPSQRDVEVSLEPSNQKGQDYLDNNVSYQQEREAIGSKQFGRTSDLLSKKYPYINKLPLEGRTFSVNYGEAVLTPLQNPDDAAIALYVDAVDAEARRTALYYISKDLSIDPSSVEFVFEGLNNPFQQEHPDE